MEGVLRAVSPKVSSEHEQEQRGRILRAAARRLCRTGYHRTTIQDICDEASLSKGAFYTYFKSKEELLAAILRESFAAPLQRARAVAQTGGDALAKLDRVAGTVAEGLSAGELQGLQSPPLLLEIWAEASKNPALNALWLEGHAQWRAFLTDLLREGIAQGVFRADLDPDGLVRILLAVFDGLALHEGVMSMKVDWHQVVQTLRQGLTEGILRRADPVRG